jgi:hypothetical protein
MKKKTFQIGETVRVAGTHDTGKIGIITGVFFHTDPITGPHHSYSIALGATSGHLMCEPEELERVADVPRISGLTSL